MSSAELAVEELARPAQGFEGVGVLEPDHVDELLELAGVGGILEPDYYLDD